MSRAVDDVKNWMNMFRWIVKLIRDEFGVDEKLLVRTATLETDCGLTIEQVEEVLEIIAESFGIRVKLEELCMVASWIKGYYKRPEFISGGYEDRCRQMNQIAA